jgi:cell division protein FtsZ
VIDDALGDEVRVTVIAAGFDRAEQDQLRDQPRADGQAGQQRQADTERDRSEPLRRTWSSPVRPVGEPARAGERGNSRSRPEDDDELDIPSFLKR